MFVKNPVKVEIFDKGTPTKTVLAEPPVKRKKLDRIISKLYEAKNINLSPSSTFNFTTTSSQIHQTFKPAVAGPSNCTVKLPEKIEPEPEAAVIKIENEVEEITEINSPEATSPESKFRQKAENPPESSSNVGDATISNGQSINQQQFLAEIINRNGHPSSCMLYL